MASPPADLAKQQPNNNNNNNNRKPKKKAPFKYLVPLVYAPALPLIRLSLRNKPVLRDRLFGLVLAGAFIHGGYLVKTTEDLLRAAWGYILSICNHISVVVYAFSLCRETFVIKTGAGSYLAPNNEHALSIVTKIQFIRRNRKIEVDRKVVDGPLSSLWPKPDGIQWFRPVAKKTSPIYR
ncbi:hypothetical protein ACFE04_001149 [Oxalis oulophora]